MTEGACDQRFGAFRIASMQLALPLDALREVVPCDRLQPFPCAVASVVGAIDLRGTVLPVVDLRRLLGQETSATSATPTVVVMLAGGRLIGLLADGVADILECPAERLSHLESHNPDLDIVCGGFPHPADGSLVSVLSAAAIAAIPGVPMVADPLAADLGASADPAGTSTNVMLSRCGTASFALPTASVHTTLLHPQIHESPLTGGFCLGVIEHSGVKVPALDPLLFFGCGERTGRRAEQAFIVRVGSGLVAFVVDEIVDVLVACMNGVVPLPAQALARPELFSGLFPLSGLPPHSVRPATALTGFYLVLDEPALQACPDLRALASLNTFVDGHDPVLVETSACEQRAGTAAQQLLTYDLGGEIATPVSQIAEIIPWQPRSALGGEGRQGALIMNRGRAIPTFCLSALIGREPPPLSPSASVLVVETDGRHVGFTVSRLMTIDEGRVLGVPAPDGCNDADPASIRHLEHMSVGTGQQERLLSLLDLKRMAQKVCA
jgi:purine-binding chemotaxis protein CheW